jgi:predicted nuclease of restriction endonuclease-like RecB superfamily
LQKQFKIKELEYQKQLVIEKEQYDQQVIELDNNFKRMLYFKDVHIDELKNIVKTLRAKLVKYKKLASLHKNSS